MKFIVYKTKAKTKIEQPVAFALQEIAGEIYVMAVDDNGNRREQGSILCINRDGTVTRNYHISNKLGLSLDKERRIVERKA